MTENRCDNPKGEFDRNREEKAEREYSSLFDLLDSEHRRIFDLLDTIDQIDRNNLDAALKTLSLLEVNLMTHLEGEERFFYTVLEAHDEATEMVLQGYEEHLMTKTLLASLNSLALDDHRWQAKLKVLRKLFEMHVRGEEILINVAKEFLDDRKAKGIADQIRAFREKGGRTKAVGEPIADL